MSYDCSTVFSELLDISGVKDVCTHAQCASVGDLFQAGLLVRNAIHRPHIEGLLELLSTIDPRVVLFSIMVPRFSCPSYLSLRVRESNTSRATVSSRWYLIQ